MQEVYAALKKRLGEYRPLAWELLPDLGLYMDQVITFVERHLDAFRTQPAEKVLTPAMVNNYVKMQLIPRPQGKKYGRDHLALLLMVCQLKRACPIEQITRLFEMQLRQLSVQELYAQFCALELSSISDVGDVLAMTPAEEKPLDYAFRMAVEAGTLCHVVQSLLLSPPEIWEEGDKGEENNEGESSKTV